MLHDVSIILSTYLSDKFINKYYKNIIELLDVSKIQLIHIFNDPTKKEIKFKKKFIDLQKKKGKNVFEYKHLVVNRESLYTSWNRAIKLANSRIIAISNVDDIRYTSGFRSQINKLQKSKSMLLLGGFNNIRTPNRLIKTKVIKKLEITKNDLFAGMYVGPFFMWSNPIFFKKKQLFFDEQFRVGADFDFQIRFAATGDIRILNECLGEYFVDNTGLSTGSTYQLIEGQVINHRYNVVDKKIFFFPYFFFKDKYLTHLFKIDGIMHPIKKIFPKINIVRRINSKRKIKFLNSLTNFIILIKIIIKKFILNRN